MMVYSNSYKYHYSKLSPLDSALLLKNSKVLEVVTHFTNRTSTFYIRN